MRPRIIPRAFVRCQAPFRGHQMLLTSSHLSPWLFDISGLNDVMVMNWGLEKTVFCWPPPDPDHFSSSKVECDYNKEEETYSKR